MKPLLLALLLLLVACSPTPLFQGEFTHEAGRLRLHPDGRIELVVEPRTSK